MAETTGQFDRDEDEAPAVSDEAIRRFLLSSLDGDEQTRIEERLFAPDDLEERVRRAECELTDDYAFQRLNQTESTQFEQHFLVSRDRQRKLEVSVALRNHLAASTARRPAGLLPQLGGHPSIGEKIRSWLGFHRPALGFAIAFTLVVVFGAVVWLALRGQRPQEPTIAQREVTSPGDNSPPVTLPGAAEMPTTEGNAPPKSTVRTPTTPVESASTSVVATFLLLPNALRDGGQKMSRLALPHGPQNERAIVRLQLALEGDQPGQHSADLLTAEGRPVYVGRRVRIEKTDPTARVVFDVPVRLLKSGDYQVKLNWIVGGSTTSGGRYYFRVTQ